MQDFILSGVGFSYTFLIFVKLRHEPLSGWCKQYHETYIICLVSD